ncbi:hypothetical protein AVEN_160567-1 [Araneus ventricosus]|uniref:RNase H type-1 domain-containing protein n=1 Tax=Araneus ventricosus TaxID=182803 RepID=A0A4Y2N3L7_ARAVE|nr:hypothetical protein AVEN_160567-1 [Araneus ventricosus]
MKTDPDGSTWNDVATCQNMEMNWEILFSSHTCIAPQSLASIRESSGKIQHRCLQIDIFPSAFQKQHGSRNGYLLRERGQIDPDIRWDETSKIRNPKKAPIFPVRSLNHVTSCNLITNTVEQHHLTLSIDPVVGLPGVFFHTNLPVQVNKQKDHPTYLRQLALEIINDIPGNAVKVYTDGSINDSDCTGSGIYIKAYNQELKIQRRNPDFCSVFRSELIAIDEGLDSLSSFSCSNEIWILTDSRSSI